MVVYVESPYYLGSVEFGTQMQYLHKSEDRYYMMKMTILGRNMWQE